MKASLCMTILSVCTASSNVFALEALNDAQLSQQTGQDGLSVSIKGDGLIGLKSLRVIDSDGFEYTKANGDLVNMKNAAGLSVNMNQKIRLCTDTASASCTASTEASTLKIDTDGGITASDSVVNVKFSSAAKSFYIPVNTLSLVGGQDTVKNGNAKWDTDVDIVKFSDGVKVDLDTPITANIQMGKQHQGNMVLISGNKAKLIDLGKLNILSYNTATPTTVASNSQIQTKVKITNFDFSNGIAVDIDKNQGIVTSFNDVSIDSIDVSDTMFGSTITGTLDNNTFDGLQNASIGNISMKNVAIKNLKVKINGL